MNKLCSKDLPKKKLSVLSNLSSNTALAGGLMPHRLVNPGVLLLDPRLPARIEDLEGAPWDVFTSPQVAKALHPDLSPLALNDWNYRGAPLRPPREPFRAWKGNIAYHRKDRLLAWARSGGTDTSPHDLWMLSARYLVEVLSLYETATMAETSELILWLLHHGLIRLRARPAMLFAPFPTE